MDDDDEDDDDDDDDDDDMDITCLVLRYGTQDTKPIIRNVDGLLVPPASSPQPMGEGRGEVAAGETLLGEAGADATTATTTGTARTIAVVDAAVGAAPFHGAALLPRFLFYEIVIFLAFSTLPNSLPL